VPYAKNGITRRTENIVCGLNITSYFGTTMNIHRKGRLGGSTNGETIDGQKPGGGKEREVEGGAHRPHDERQRMQKP